MTESQKALYAMCVRRGTSPAVRARIVRLNPRWSFGERVRGWHPAHTRRGQALINDLVSKGEFIRRFGRPAWESLPNGLLWRFGHRRYVARSMVLDNIWKVWAGQIPPCQGVEWFPTKQYANDKALVVEYISREEFLSRRAAG
jgi:hypothetical protein